ncbi:ribokinase [Nesterenkonia muleiensis]|uniref:ribokinase n=1 Tax=Nesterenkonia muleiensis TaxID=2282648 RepID=UPI000E729EE1|nr:ribokinase [Nesterenkonia muleiensis]
MMTKVPVAVIGSVNIDITIYTRLRPAAGETVLGWQFNHFIGGKGFNQALAAGPLVPTTLLSAVGGTEHSDIVEALTDKEVETQDLKVLEETTGHAFITVTPDGENSIVVVPGANEHLKPSDIRPSLDITQPDVVLTQREIPAETVAAARRWAEENSARYALNASPVAGITAEDVATCDPLIVNIHEAQHLVEHDPRETTPVQMLTEGLQRLTRSAVLTAGEQGAWAIQANSITYVPPEPVTHVVDTTGAGDTFAGVLCAHLALGDSLIEAAREASRAAAEVVAVPRAER